MHFFLIEKSLSVARTRSSFLNENIDTTAGFEFALLEDGDRT